MRPSPQARHQQEIQDWQYSYFQTFGSACAITRIGFREDWPWAQKPVVRLSYDEDNRRLCWLLPPAATVRESLSASHPVVGATDVSPCRSKAPMERKSRSSGFEVILFA